VAARDPHFFKEQELPHHRPNSLLLWEADEPDHAEGITEFVDMKVNALLAHESQLESTMHAVSDEQVAAFCSRIRARLHGLGAPLGLGSAEVFKHISDL
jgi:LmbE family N-acetylglucosaminyl deacetylase